MAEASVLAEQIYELCQQYQDDVELKAAAATLLADVQCDRSMTCLKPSPIAGSGRAAATTDCRVSQRPGAQR